MIRFNLSLICECGHDVKLLPVGNSHTTFKGVCGNCGHEHNCRVSRAS